MKSVVPISLGRFIGFTAVLLLLAAAPLGAGNFTTGNGPAAVFGVHEVSLTGNGGAADPFATVGTVTFTPPSGSAHAVTVGMFWDGGNDWRARAYVTEAGNWTWTSHGAGDPGLDGKTGSFHAVPAALRGKLKPHPANPRALVTDNGKWFAPIGDTAYCLLGSADYQNYVRDDWNHGVDFVRCSSFGHLRDFAAHFTASGVPGIPNLSSLQSDDAKLNWMLENYPGMYLQYIMLPENPAANWSMYSVTARDELLQQMVARFGAFPAITWQIMNDSPYPADGTGNTAVANTVGTFLVARDVYGHLRGTGARRGKEAPFANSAWTTFLHYETKDAVAADEADRSASHHKFTWCGEDRYETYIPPAQARYFFRRLMWAWLLSGGSACYGGAWDKVIPYSAGRFTGLDSIAPITRYLATRDIDLGLFVCDDSMADDPLATGKDRPQACHRESSEYLIYHPNGTGTAEGVNVNAERTASFKFDLTGMRGEGKVEWFKCLDGTIADGGTVQGGAVRTLTAPWIGQDVVCRIVGGGGTGPRISRSALPHGSTTRRPPGSVY